MRGYPETGGFDMRPRILDSDAEYKSLSAESKELYTKLYNRACLSATKGDAFKDRHGLYVVFTLDEACSQLNCKRDKAMKTFKELEKAGLIQRRRYGYGNPYRIYVKDLLGRLDKTISAVPKKTTSINQENQHDEVGVFGVNYNKISNHDDIESYLSYMSIDHIVTEEQIKEKIEYDVLCDDIPTEILDRIVRIMVSKCNSRKNTIRVSDCDVPQELVKKKLLQLNDIHIRFVCDKLSKTTAEIKSVDAFCLHLLLNAQEDMEIQTQARINRDYAAGKI